MKQSWKSGDIFLIPNSDGGFTAGQVLAYETRTLHSASCALFDQRVQSIDDGKSLTLERSKCFAALLITPESLDKGLWPVVSHQQVVLPKALHPFEKLLQKTKIGARVHGSGIVQEFANAYYALRPWDDWYRPDYLDGMLISPAAKPKNLIFKSPLSIDATTSPAAP
jgi:hypothetical protein